MWRGFGLCRRIDGGRISPEKRRYKEFGVVAKGGTRILCATIQAT